MGTGRRQFEKKPSIFSFFSFHGVGVEIETLGILIEMFMMIFMCFSHRALKKTKKKKKKKKSKKKKKNLLTKKRRQIYIYIFFFFCYIPVFIFIFFRMLTR